MYPEQVAAVGQVFVVSLGVGVAIAVLAAVGLAVALTVRRRR